MEIHIMSNRNARSFAVCASLLAVACLILGDLAYGVETKAEPYIRAALEKAIKVRGAKVGDKITAKTIAPAVLKDGTEIKKGTRIHGHITRVEQKDANGVSQIGVIFDGIEITKGSPTAVVMALTSVAPGPELPNVSSLAYNNPGSGAARIDGMSANAGRSSTPTQTGLEGVGMGLKTTTPEGLETGLSTVEEVEILGFAAVDPGTIFINRKGLVFIDSTTRILLEMK